MQNLLRASFHIDSSFGLDNNKADLTQNYGRRLTALRVKLSKHAADVHSLHRYADRPLQITMHGVLRLHFMVKLVEVVYNQVRYLIYYVVVVVDEILWQSECVHWMVEVQIILF